VTVTDDSATTSATETARLPTAPTAPGATVSAPPTASVSQTDGAMIPTAPPDPGQAPAKTQTRKPATAKRPTVLAPLPVVISGARASPGQKAPRRSTLFGGPRSRTARLTLWTVAGVAVVIFLLGATPLGQASPVGAAFQAYAQSVPWIAPPTATPKPVPQKPAPGVNPGQQAIINKITAVFGPYAPGAINVARCESDFDPNAWNSIAIGGSHASGVFQILYPTTWIGTSYARSSPYDADANIRAAYEIFRRDGYSWREWACKP
jgi:hypothetical protein